MSCTFTYLALAFLSLSSCGLEAMEKKSCKKPSLCTQYYLKKLLCARLSTLLQNPSILHRAIASYQDEEASLILGLGANPALQNGEGQNAMHVALINGNLDFARALVVVLDLEALSSPDVHGHNSLDYALSLNFNDFAHELRQRGVNSSANIEDQTDLHRAVNNGDSAAIREILAIQPELINVPDGEGHAPLHCALIEGFNEGALILIELGADLDVVFARSTTDLEARRLVITPREFIRATGSLDLLRML